MLLPARHSPGRRGAGGSPLAQSLPTCRRQGRGARREWYDGADMPSQAVVELLRRYGDKAYNFAFRLTGNEQDARDLAQEAFVRILEHAGRYDPSRPFEAWMLTILRNIYLDGLRRASHGATVSFDAPSPAGEQPWEEILRGPDPDPAQAMIRQEADGMIQGALDSLSPHYRTAVILCDIEGLSYEQIGEIMDCPIGTVRSRIHQGRVLLRRAFENLRKGGVPR